jgi:hypothetical protein
VDNHETLELINAKIDELIVQLRRILVRIEGLVGDIQDHEYRITLLEDRVDEK